jgi:hypothetical protein
MLDLQRCWGGEAARLGSGAPPMVGDRAGRGVGIEQGEAYRAGRGVGIEQRTRETGVGIEAHVGIEQGGTWIEAHAKR